MKQILLCGILFAQLAQAAEPSDEIIHSCLSSHSISQKVKVDELPTNEILTQDDYKSGYNATYYFNFKGKDIGYAEKKELHGIIYAGDIYPINTAKPLLGIKEQPVDFNPSLADWNMVSDATGKYLCTSFPYGDLGLSGSFQAIRGAYLLSGLTDKHARRLFFVVANMNAYKK